MNLVKMIEEQLSGDSLKKLSTAVGADPESTGAAASAAIPTLLSGLVSQFSSADGARRLSNVLGGIDANGMGNFANMLGGDSSALLGKGSGLLGSLFGEGMIGSAANAISRFSGLSPSAVKSLLAYLMPLVLGKVATQWKSQGGTPSALSNLLTDQKRNIADAMPAGYSLGDIPGMSDAKDAARSAADATRRGAEMTERAAPSMASWLIPAAVLLLGGFLLWNVLKPKPAEQPVAAESTPEGETVVAMKPAIPEIPEIPSASQLGSELNDTFRSLGDTFSSMQDAASAEAAVPKLEEMSTKIDSFKKMFARLPDAGRATLRKSIEAQLNPLLEKAQQTLAIPGLSERIKTLINQIVTKLEEWKIVEQAG